MNDTNGIPTRKVYTLLGRCPEGTGKIASALAKAIPNIAPLVRNRSSHFARKGPDGKPVCDYADLAQCHKAASRALAEQSLVVVQTLTNNTEGEMVLCTQLLHASGEWIESNMPIKASLANPQQVAAAITYARRTAYCAIVGMAADDDDDGSTAEETAARAAPEDYARVEKMAMDALVAAKDGAARAKVLAHAEQRAGEGTFPKAALDRLVARSAELDASAAKKRVPTSKEPVTA
jgi:hypothetical protein